MQGAPLISAVVGMVGCLVVGFIAGWITAATLVRADLDRDLDREEDALVAQSCQVVQDFTAEQRP